MVDWSLRPRPINVLETLASLGAGQEQARMQQQREAEMAQIQKQQMFQQQLGAAIDPVTGRVNEGAARLAYIGSGNAEGALKFTQDRSTDFAKRRKEVAEPIAQTAWKVLEMPPEQQAAAFYNYVDQFAQTNPAAAQFRDVPPDKIPQFLEAMLAEVGWLDDFQRDNEEKPFNVGPEDGRYIMDPTQPGGVRTIIAPNSGQGQFGEPVDTSTAPQVGAVVGGFTFKGGNPKDRNNWVQGGQGASPGTFLGQ